MLAVRLSDPREVDLPDIGPVIMEDAETGEQIYVDTHDRRFRARFQEAAQTPRSRSERRPSSRPAVDALPLSTDEDLVRAIVRFAALRQQRRK